MSLVDAQRNLVRVGGLLETGLIAICAVLLTTIFASVFTGVIVRYVSMVPWSWTEEVARYCLVWFAPLAAAIGARRGSHFAFNWALLPLQPGTRVLVRQISNVLIIAFLLLLVKLSVGFLEVMENQTSLALELDMRIPAFGLTFGFSVLIAMHVLEVADAVMALFTGQHFSVRELQEKENIRTLEAQADLINPAIIPAVAAE
jgi:TRAP-type C4-dicarboxylate transport system permease small subunit